MSYLIATRRTLLGSKGITYLLRDEFDDTVAAGSVNGTAATPGPGKRVVTDTGGNGLSLTGGACEIITRVSNADPKLTYSETFVRTAGRYLIGNLERTKDRSMSWGYDSDRISLSSSTIIAVSSGTPVVGAVSLDTEYQIAIVARASGMYLLIKGGAFTDWTLLWAEMGGTTTPLVFTLNPLQSVVGGTIWRNRYNRIPDRLFIPMPMVYDSFTRANGALGSSETVGPDSQVVTARTWESGGATWAIAGNEAVNTPTLGGEELTDGGLEDTYTAGKCDTLFKAGAPTLAEETVDLHGGSSAQEYTATAQYDAVFFAAYTPAAGEWLEYSIWAKRTAGSSGTVRPVISQSGQTTPSNTTAITQSSYTQIFISWLSLSTSVIYPYALREYSASAYDTVLVDDCSLKQLTLNELITDVDDGETSDYLAEVECDTIVDGTMAGMVLSLDDKDTPANFILGFYDRGSARARLIKFVAGTPTSVIEAAATYAAGAKLVVIKEGTSYSLFYNNAKIGSTSTISDAGIISNTKHGLFSSNSGNQLDGFTIFYRTHADYETEFENV